EQGGQGGPRGDDGPGVHADEQGEVFLRGGDGGFQRQEGGDVVEEVRGYRTGGGDGEGGGVVKHGLDQLRTAEHADGGGHGGHRCGQQQRRPGNEVDAEEVRAFDPREHHHDHRRHAAGQ